MTAWFLEALLASPDKSLDLLPGGKARAAKLIDQGDRRRDGQQTDLQRSDDGHV
jgi:hypothetical protein